MEVFSPLFITRCCTGRRMRKDSPSGPISSIMGASARRRSPLSWPAASISSTRSSRCSRIICTARRIPARRTISRRSWPLAELRSKSPRRSLRRPNTCKPTETAPAALFQDALGRGADPAARAFFAQELSAGATRRQVAAQILSSDEYRQDLVNDAYIQFLGRSADAAALDRFTAGLGGGMCEQQLIEQIAASDEFFKNASR